VRSDDTERRSSLAIDSDNDDTPVYMNGTPQGTPLIDNEGKTHWVGPTSPRLSTYINVIDRLENRTRNSSFDSNMPSFRIVADLYLAEVVNGQCLSTWTRYQTEKDGLHLMEII
jgi:hypothetical protein